MWPPVASKATTDGVRPSKSHGAVRLALALSLLKGSWGKLRAAVAELTRLVVCGRLARCVWEANCDFAVNKRHTCHPIATSCRRVLQGAGWWLAGLPGGRAGWHGRRWHLLLAGLLGAKLLHTVLSALHSLIFSRAERREKLRLNEVMRQAATHR